MDEKTDKQNGRGGLVAARIVASLLLLWALSAAPSQAAPVMRVVRPARHGTSLLRNGGFETVQGDKVAGWQAWQNGFRAAPGEGRGGSRAIVCENQTGAGELGASQTLELNRTAAAPLVVRGWSKAREVSGSPDSGYSLYVDLTYADGTPLWGQTADFRCGTHDWQRQEFVIQPEKPVKSLTVYCLFRGHTGQVWFDDVSVEEIRAPGDAALFQGVPVRVVPQPSSRRSGATTMTTQDGLRLTLRGGAVASLQAGGRELAAAAPSGFLARDMAANSDLYGFENGACPTLGLKLQAHFEAKPNHIEVRGRLSNTTGRDRAVTLVFALPLEATGWQWGDDIRRSRQIEGQGEYADTVPIHCGATGALSRYPLAAIWDGRTGLALALDMAQPAQYRLAYDAGTKQLLIAYDFGLVKETERFPSSADFRFILCRFDPDWGFRAAFQKLTEIFPDYFRVRSHDQGLWMPFTDISTVQGWQDFGFRYHEGDNNVPFDNAHGILSFRYTEPMTWWMPMPKGAPRTEAEALRIRDEWAAGSNEQRRRMAQVTRVAAMTDPDGQPYLLFRSEPWNDGAVWSLNPNPYLPDTLDAGAPGLKPRAVRDETRLRGLGGESVSNGEAAHRTPPLNAATVYWNDAIKQRLYGPEAKGHLDGEYLDSLEGYVTADLNFRREHFRYTTVPLTFASDTKQPALFKGLAVFELTHWISADVHRLGKLMFANGVPYRFSFLCPWLDVMGTETNWLRGGRYEPAPDAEMSLWRTMSGQKPYLLLMNTDFDAFNPAMVEKYFQRSLFYGMFPGMFSHNAADNPYWRNPSWYNRDRPLFKKYIPLIEQIAEAGWQPVTEARCDNPGLFIERFGPDAHGVIYFTLMNQTAQPQSGVVTLDGATLKLSGAPTASELLSGQSLPLTGTRFPVTLAPEQTWAVRVTAQR